MKLYLEFKWFQLHTKIYLKISDFFFTVSHLALEQSDCFLQKARGFTFLARSTLNKEDSKHEL